jgi:hypothetical protein
MARPKSEATKLYKALSQKMTGPLFKLAVITPLVLIAIYFLFRIGGFTQGVTTAQEDRRATEAAQAAARAEQVALARAQVNEELLRFDEGVWLLQDHTLGTEREVYMDSFSVDRGGEVEEFVFKYSFTGNGRAYANTWSCEVSQMQRYDCTVRQQHDGGSWRNEGDLLREDDSSFNGRYLYEHQWYEVSLVRKEE